MIDYIDYLMRRLAMKISIKDDLSRFKYIVLFILFILGNSKNVLFAYLAFIFILLCILIESKEENIYMIFFLLPNIRILDATGITSLINVAVFFASLKYILISKRLNEKKFNCRIVFFDLGIIAFILYGELY